MDKTHLGIAALVAAIIAILIGIVAYMEGNKALRKAGEAHIAADNARPSDEEIAEQAHKAVSAELIATIFTTPSPLHDGAVIVRGSLIVAARCTLPLTQNPRYRRVLGMRHQAAVGISEESDAVVIVVSEESGRISVAHQGRLIRRLDVQALHQLLVELLQDGGKQMVA